MRKQIIGGVSTFLVGAFMVGLGMSCLFVVSVYVSGLNSQTFKILEISLFIGLSLMIISAALFIWAVVSDAKK